LQAANNIAETQKAISFCLIKIFFELKATTMFRINLKNPQKIFFYMMNGILMVYQIDLNGYIQYIIALSKLSQFSSTRLFTGK